MRLTARTLVLGLIAMALLVPAPAGAQYNRYRQAPAATGET